jgi:hypothetical protein
LQDVVPDRRRHHSPIFELLEKRASELASV